MDNASKNAGDMISSLQMQYNRGRQAAITNELVDIITGTFYMPAERRNDFRWAFFFFNRRKRPVNTLLPVVVWSRGDV